LTDIAIPRKDPCPERRKLSPRARLAMIAGIVGMVLSASGILSLAIGIGEWKATVEIERKNDRANAAAAVEALELKQDVKFQFLIDGFKEMQRDIKSLLRRGDQP
jgi:hypothetical protein